jgi:hypothetical protein
MRKLALRVPEGCLPVTDNDVKKIEELIGHPLPLDYAQFLREQAGGFVSKSNAFLPLNDEPVREVFGEGFILDKLNPTREPGFPHGELSNQIRTYSGRIPDETIPVASNAFGDNLLLGVGAANTGKVYLWDHEREGIVIKSPADNTYLIADSFSEFLNALQPVPPIT